MSEASARPSRRRWLRRAVLLAGSLALGVLLLELTLRVLTSTSTEAGLRMRRAELYTDRWSDPLYFQLDQRWHNLPGPLLPQVADARLGWSFDQIDHESYVAPGEDDLDERRPVLLFGDSYTACMTDDANCFEGWMERSPMGATHRIFNYGVHGYGIDQIALLAGYALEHWRGRNAIVAIGIFVDDDLDRAWLDHRGWPKPRFELDEAGRLIEPGPVPSPEQYEREHPVWKRSLAWGWFLNGSGLLPERWRDALDGRQRRDEKKRALCWAILDRLEHDLQRAGVERFYVLFPGPEQFESLEPRDWREAFLLDWLHAHDAPYVSVKREILRAALAAGRHPTEYFGQRGALSEHLTPDGNEVAFQALLRGIQGDFDRTGGSRPPHPSELRILEGRGQSGRARIEYGWSERFPDAADRERILLAPGADAPARVGCMLSAPATRFLATAKLAPGALEQGATPMRLEIRVDRELVVEATLDAARPSMDLEIPMFNRSNIEILVRLASSEAGMLILSRPRFQ